MPSTTKTLCTVAAAACLWAGASQAATPWPNRPITMIMPMSAGGGGDVLGRALGDEMSKYLGVPIIIENKPGATGIIALGHAAKQAPDGYSILMSSVTFQIHNDLLRHDLPFDTVKDFAPVSMVGEGVFTFVVPATSPHNTLSEFLASTEGKPQGTTYGSWGQLSAGHILGEQLAMRAPGKLLHVPYKGEVNMVNDLVGGNLESGWLTQLTARTMLDNGRIKVLATSGPERNPALPDVATFTEQGVDGYEMTGWTGLYAPAGTPPAVVAKLAEAVQAALATPALQERTAALGMSVVASGPQEFAARFAEDHAKWKRVVDSVKLE